MPLRRVISEKALQDIDDIVAYISADNESAAFRVHQAIYEHIDCICESPTLGNSLESPVLQNARYSAVSKFRNYNVFFDRKVMFCKYCEFCIQRGISVKF